MDNLENKTKNAFKWSTITEIVARVLQPITNMILARILVPDAFGALATILMVIAFAEVFVESGFQKFLIQYEFKDEAEEKNYISVAFWSNLIFSILIWAVIIVFRFQLAEFVGNRNLGTGLAVTSVVIPLYGIIGIQNSRLRKNLNFKKLFWVRIVAAFVPVFVTIPCALMGLGYWALIIGNIAGAIVRSVMLYRADRFIPELFFSKRILTHMLRYGIWTLLDGLAVWMTQWIDTLIISQNLSDYYLGLYKNSITTITEFVAIVTSAVTPVLFASLSRVQNEDVKFKKTFLDVQHILSLFLIPMGVGLYFYRDLATTILFGNQWSEAADIVGIMSLTLVVRTILVSFYSDAYRAKGKFQVPLYLQIVDIAILVPACVWAVNRDFWTLVYVRAFARLDLIIPEIFIAYLVCKISPKETFKAISHPIIATVAMSIVVVFLQMIGNSIVWQFVSIGIAIIVYFCVLFLYREERNILNNFIGRKTL